MSTWRAVLAAAVAVPLLAGAGAGLAQTTNDPAADVDHDGKAGTADACPERFGTTANGCPTSSMAISIFYSPKTKKWSGRLTGADRACVQRRTAVLQKFRGKNGITIATAPTDAKGVWRVKRRPRKGTYQVLVGATTIPGAVNCARTVSKRFRQR